MGYGWKMKWSKLRHQVESMFAESVKGRVGLHSTRYRTMHDHDGRSWITIDGKEILNMALWWKWEDAFWKWMGPRADGMAPYGQEYDQQMRRAKKELARESFFWQEDLGDAMHEYLSLSIDEIVYSSNVIIRAIGMLDARFGKRRLKNLDVSNEPDLVKVLYAFRCHAENIENISCWEPHKIEPSLENYETEREKIYRGFRETATEKLIHSKITRKIPNLIRSISEGTICEEDLDTPLSNAIYRGYHEATDRENLGQYLLYINSKSRLLQTEHHAKGVIALMKNSTFWLRPLESWVPDSHNADKQFSSLARHLWAKYDVPVFMDKAWLQGNPTHQEWFKHLGAGKNIRTAIDLPIPLTKMMAHHFLQAPASYSIEAAIRWGQVHSLEGNQRLADALQETQLVRDFRDDDFWLTVLRFFVNSPMLDTVHINPIIDFIWHQRYEPRVAFLQPGVAQDIGPAQPNFSMRGRTVDSLLRAVDEWHRQLGRETKGGQFQWKKSDIENFTFIEGSKESKNMRIWRISELLSSKELITEGRQMKHCVATYGHSCNAGACSIWTMDVETEHGVEKLVTIEVNKAKNEIRQIRGRHNRIATDREKSVIMRWAEQSGLTMATYV